MDTIINQTNFPAYMTISVHLLNSPPVVTIIFSKLLYNLSGRWKRTS
jgi:hypothetical protein